MADVGGITNAAARWLIEHDRSGRAEADDPKLIAHVVAQTGHSENVVFDVLVDHWADVRSAVSSGAHQAARGSVAAQLKTAGHESPPIPGVISIPLDDTSWLTEGVLWRTATTDRKGRPYGTNRNPGVPPIEQFNPRIWEVRAGDLAKLISERKHGRNPDQRESLAQLENETLLAFNRDDPISARWSGATKGLALTGGHHRTWEIIDRVADGRMDANTPVRILVHE